VDVFREGGGRARPELPPEDRKDFLESLGLTESGLDRLAHAAYHLLGLQSYFTAGEKEVRRGPSTGATRRRWRRA